MYVSLSCHGPWVCSWRWDSYECPKYTDFRQPTAYPKKYAHGFCFAVLCCGYTLTDFPISIRLTSLALWQSNDCPSASKATLINMDKYFIWIHYERLHNHNKAKHNKTVCMFLGIYCIFQIATNSNPSFIVFSSPGTLTLWCWNLFMQLLYIIRYSIDCSICLRHYNDSYQYAMQFSKWQCDFFDYAIITKNNCVWYDFYADL